MDTVWLAIHHVPLARTQPLAAPAQALNSSVNHFAHQLVWMDTTETQSHTDAKPVTRPARPAHQEEKMLVYHASQDLTCRTTFVFKTAPLEHSPQTESALHVHRLVPAALQLLITAHHV